MPIEPSSSATGVDGNAVVDALVSQYETVQRFAYAKGVFLVNPDTGQPYTASGGGGGGAGDASAANQLTQIARAEAIRDRLPATLGTKAAGASMATVQATGALSSVSGTIATGGTAQTLAAPNAARRGVTVQNVSNQELRVSPWGTASASAGIKVGPDQLLVLDAPHCGVGAISIWGAATGQAFQGAEAV